MTADTLAALAALPRLAAQAAPRHTGRGGADGIRTAPGSKPPPGVDLDAIDVSNGRQHPHMLARISQCVRVVDEERRRVDLWQPAPTAEEEVSWASECRWLLATADWWTADPWCVEWVTTEVQHVRGKLSALLERMVDPRTCDVCGVRLEAHTTDTLMVATCPACERVAGMRPRRLLTTREAAERLGVTDRAVRMRVQSGQLPAEGVTNQGGYLIAEDGLDWARRKLGLAVNE